MPRNGQREVRPVRFDYERGHSTGEHAHDEHQLVYASRGLLCVDTEGARSVVPPQRAVWVPARCPHTVTAMTPSRMSTLYLGPEITIAGIDTVTVITVNLLLRELINHLFDGPPAGQPRDRLEAVLLDQLATATTPALSLPQPSDPRLRAIADILNDNPADGRTLKQLGHHVGAGERTLQRLFHREIGTTFGRWRTQLRLQHAIIALGQHHSVSTAAAKVGYNEPSAFIAAFRRTFGTTPARYLAPTRQCSPPDRGMGSGCRIGG